MVFFNWATMQMAAKIVYYGPGLCGKTTNLSFIYAKTSPNSRGEMVSLETESDRTLFFDLLPIEVGTIGGFKTRLQLYTVPGQVFYNTTRKLVLKGVDGVVFVADSQRPMREANIESFDNLRENLAELGLSLGELPVVIQYNKRDLRNILTLDELNADLNPERAMPFFEASALNGDGVFETLKEITKLTLKKLRKRMAAPQPGLGPRPVSGPVRPVSAVAPARPATISAAALARAAEEGVEAGEAAAAPPPRAGDEAATRAPVPAGPVEEQPSAVQAEPFPPEAPAGEPFEQPPEQMAEAVEAEAPERLEEPETAGEQEPEPLHESEVEASDLPGADAEGEEEAAAQLSPADAGPADGEPSSLEATDPDMQVEFDQSEETPSEVESPPVKRVQVSNQMDILAELDSLRKQATMAAPRDRERRAASTPDLDLDALLGTPRSSSRELRRKVAHTVNSDLFRYMSSLHLAVRLQDEKGETLHTFAPIEVDVGDAASLERLSLLLTLDLENLR